MKTVTQIALTGVATVLFAAGSSAFAGDSEVRVIDNHHGAFTYLSRPAPAQTQTTVAVYAHGQAVGQANANTTHGGVTYRQVSTAEGGTISYATPGE